jgi:hypothetical protein
MMLFFAKTRNDVWPVFAFVSIQSLAFRAHCITGLPDFSWSKHTKLGKIEQINTDYTKRPLITYTNWPLNIPNGHK